MPTKSEVVQAVSVLEKIFDFVLVCWLKQRFISKRGEDCYDGEDAYKKVMEARKKKN